MLLARLIDFHGHFRAALRDVFEFPLHGGQLLPSAMIWKKAAKLGGFFAAAEIMAGIGMEKSAGRKAVPVMAQGVHGPIGIVSAQQEQLGMLNRCR